MICSMICISNKDSKLLTIKNYLHLYYKNLIVIGINITQTLNLNRGKAVDTCSLPTSEIIFSLRRNDIFITVQQYIDEHLFWKIQVSLL